LGTQELSVVLSVATPTVLTSSIILVPEVTGLKASKEATRAASSRVVVAGGEIIVQFADSIPSEIRQKLNVSLAPTDGGSQNRKMDFLMPESDYLVLKIPADLDRQTYEVQVRADTTLLDRKPRIRVEYVSSIYKWASIVLLSLITLIYILYRLFYKTAQSQKRYSFVKMLLVEQENQTYSLSRAQFLGWLTVIVWSYLFLYYAHGFVEQDWSYPSLGNAVYAFLISLGTLVVAQATGQGLGVKGAGEDHPSLADLVVHGGVIALDRVQQVIWTLIALGMFLRITVSSFGAATTLPDIPPELLVLMGLSSAGYLGGKLVRGPGPVIEQVSVREGSLILDIKGRHLSRDGFIWLDGVQLKDKPTVKVDDPDDPLKFASEVEVTLAITRAEWDAREHTLTFVNADAQRADWHATPEITAVAPGQPDAQNKVLLTIKSARVAPGATVIVSGAGNAKPIQNPQDPNVFTVQVDAAWLTEPHELALNTGGKQSIFTYQPA
jgi:hypothetical protein